MAVNAMLSKGITLSIDNVIPFDNIAFTAI